MVEADAPDEVAIGVATAGPRATAAAITARTSFTCSPGEGRTDTGLRSGLSVPCAVRFRSPEELHVSLVRHRAAPGRPDLGHSVPGTGPGPGRLLPVRPVPGPAGRQRVVTRACCPCLGRASWRTV